MTAPMLIPWRHGNCHTPPPARFLFLLALLLVVSPCRVNAQWKRMWEYIPPTTHSSLSSAQPQPLKRAAHSLVAYQDSLYLFGGIGDTTKTEDYEFDDTWKFNLESELWTQVIGDREGSSNASGSAVVSPQHRFHHATALHVNATVAEMVVFGGLSITQKPRVAGATVSTSVDMIVTQFNDVWRLSLEPDKEVWRVDPRDTNRPATGSSGNGSAGMAPNTTPPANAPVPRSEAGAIAHDGQLYVFGGIAYDEVVDAAPKDFGDLWRYDLSNCTWTQLTPAAGDVAPPARFSHSLTKFTTDKGETFLVVFSGRHLELPLWSLLGDTWIFSLTTLRWRRLQTTVPLQRAYTSVIATGGATPKLWFFGGYFRPKQGSKGYVYDDVVGGYLLPAPSSSAAADDMTGGGVDTTPTRIQFYHAVMGPDDAVPPLRYNHRAVLWRDTMVLHGGSYQSQRGDVWQFNITDAVMKQDTAAGLPVNMETLVYVLGGFVFSIVIVLVVLIVRWRRIDRRNLELARMRGVASVRGLPRERLDRMEIIKYKKPTAEPSPATGPTTPPAAELGSDGQNDQNNEDICPICLIEFEEDEDVRNLPCKHLFHVACIDEWLGRNTTCPMCKNNLDLEIVNVEIVPDPELDRARQPSVAAPPVSPSIEAQAQSRGGSIVTPVLTRPS